MNSSGLSKSSGAAEIVTLPESLGTPENIATLKRYAINTNRAFGVPNSVPRPLSRQAGRDHSRALDLWDTGWREFVRRAAFAMMAVGAVHLKKRSDDDIIAWLPLVTRHASDPRNFVRKAVSWALRQIGKRSQRCHATAMEIAKTLSRSDDKTERWIGKDAAKELSSDKVKARLALQ